MTAARMTARRAVKPTRSSELCSAAAAKALLTAPAGDGGGVREALAPRRTAGPGRGRARSVSPPRPGRDGAARRLASGRFGSDMAAAPGCYLLSGA
ncbi:hypothetical protein MMIN_26270 [Mycolicibacter minnesotensis]|nr:hypothetical protein MMIN_26270 [Mycolicibacter minnesotensis]